MLLGCCKYLIGADSGYVSLVERRGTAVRLLFIDPGEWFRTADSSLPALLRGMAEVACRRGGPVFVNDFLHGEFAGYAPESPIPLGNVLFSPFAVTEDTMGLLALANKAGGFTGKDAATAAMLCELAAIALLYCLPMEGAVDTAGGSYGRGEECADGPIASPGGDRQPAQQKNREAEMSESLENLRRFAVRLQESQERERQRISFELHEGVAQAIVVLKMELNALKSRFCRGRTDVAEEGCQRMIGHLDGVIRNVRRLYSRLSTASVEDLGFSVALRSMMREFGETTGIRCTASVADSLQGLWPLPVQIGVYRILQDALEGIARDVAPWSIALRAEKAGCFITFFLDSRGGSLRGGEGGKPCLPEEKTWLATLGERVKLMGGRMSVGGGTALKTKLSFAVPLSRAAGMVYREEKNGFQ
ncbi:MAG: histidine kinase [Syntrophobacteraceae bacterium]|nr:histidine kinase [Desulfobacteraceae bacterium]